MKNQKYAPYVKHQKREEVAYQPHKLEDFYLEVAKGNIEGHDHVNKFGHNPTASGGDDIWGALAGFPGTGGFVLSSCPSFVMLLLIDRPDLTAILYQHGLGRFKGEKPPGVILGPSGGKAGRTLVLPVVEVLHRDLQA